MKTYNIKFDKERSEKNQSLSEFLVSYNQNLPSGYPRASTLFLKEFKKTYPALFNDEGMWSLDKHRKKFMDWHAQHAKPLLR